MTSNRQSPSRTVTLSPEAAEILAGVPNASAYVDRAVLRMAGLDKLRTMVERHGYQPTDEGIARAGEKLLMAEARRAARRRAAA